MMKWLGVLGVLTVTGLAAGPAWAGSESAAPAAGAKVNACGCYRDATGSCFCGKKGKCVCPGECEPKGCDEKRAKEMEKEVEAEIKRAKETEKKQRDAEMARKKRAETVDDQEESAAAARLEAAEAEAAGESGDAKAKHKESRKGKAGKASGESATEK